jgi:CheY-like chemotaxis protein
MGGEIHVRSTPGEGSEFRFTVRLSEPVELSNGSARALSAAVNHGATHGIQLRVLVAEDNPVNQRVIQAILAREGHLSTVVSDGRDAVEAARQNAFDLILMDVQMPSMDGFEATAALRAAENGRHTPIVAMTAHAMKGDQQRCLEAGMDDYLTKPIVLENLRAVLARVSSELEQPVEVPALPK